MYISCEIDHMRIINIAFNDNYIDDMKLFIKLFSSRLFLFLIDIVSMQIDFQFLLDISNMFLHYKFSKFEFFFAFSVKGNTSKYIKIKKVENRQILEQNYFTRKYNITGRKISQTMKKFKNIIFLS